MTEIKPEYKIKRLTGNGKLNKDFPVKIIDNKKMLKFFVDYIKIPLSQGACQIVIHSDGQMIRYTEEKRVNK